MDLLWLLVSSSFGWGRFLFFSFQVAILGLRNVWRMKYIEALHDSCVEKCLNLFREAVGVPMASSRPIVNFRHVVVSVPYIFCGRDCFSRTLWAKSGI